MRDRWCSSCCSACSMGSLKRRSTSRAATGRRRRSFADPPDSGAIRCATSTAHATVSARSRSMSHARAVTCTSTYPGLACARRTPRRNACHSSVVRHVRRTPLYPVVLEGAAPRRRIVHIPRDGRIPRATVVFHCPLEATAEWHFTPIALPAGRSECRRSSKASFTRVAPVPCASDGDCLVANPCTRCRTACVPASGSAGSRRRAALVPVRRRRWSYLRPARAHSLRADATTSMTATTRPIVSMRAQSDARLTCA
jgi:hypothetical protein